jgi:hypothetical protein
LRNLNNDAPLKAPTTPPFLFTDLFWSSWSMPICSFPSFFSFFLFFPEAEGEEKVSGKDFFEKKGKKKDSGNLSSREKHSTHQNAGTQEKKQALSPHLDVLGRLGEAERVEAAVAGERAVEPGGAGRRG